MSAQFPLVPNSPGVPPVYRLFGTVSGVVLLNQDAGLLLDALGPKVKQWILLDSTGQPALEPDNYMEWEFSQDWNIATYPVEGGGWATYDRVKTPPTVRIQVTKGGSDVERNKFLNTVNYIANLPAALYTLQTPDYIYNNLTIQHYDIERSARSGVSLLTVNIYFQQANIIDTAIFSQTAKPDGLLSQQIGTGSTQTPVDPGAAGARGAQ
jgi:hypothetical protein